MDPVYYVFIIAVFLTVVLLLEGGYLWWRSSRGEEARRLSRRLHAAALGGGADGDEMSFFKERLLSESPGMQRMLSRVQGVRSLDARLIQSGLDITVGRFLLRIALAAGAGLVISLVAGLGMLWSLLVVPACAALPVIHVVNAGRKRLRRIEEQLPDAVDLIARALRAGHAFPNSVRMVADEMTDPIGGEFRMLADEVTYGGSMQDALLNLAARVPSTDVKYFVVAVLIQRETGGNLAELLDNIASIVRARLKLLGAIRVLSAEGRLSAWILSLLPFAAALMIHLLNPAFMSVLWTDPLGMKLVGTAIFMMVLGILAMRHIVRIRV